MKLFVIYLFSVFCGYSESLDPPQRVVSIDLTRTTRHRYSYGTSRPLAAVLGSVASVLKSESAYVEVLPNDESAGEPLLELPKCAVILSKFDTPREVVSEEEWRKFQIRVTSEISANKVFRKHPWVPMGHSTINLFAVNGLISKLWNSSDDGTIIVSEYLKTISKSFSMKLELFEAFRENPRTDIPPQAIAEEWRYFANQILAFGSMRRDGGDIHVWMPRTVILKVLHHRISCFWERVFEINVAKGIWRMPANLAQMWTLVVAHHPEVAGGLTIKIADMYTELIASVNALKQRVEATTALSAREAMVILTGGQLSGKYGKMDLYDYPFAAATRNMFLTKGVISEAMLRKLVERSTSVLSLWDNQRGLTQSFQDTYEIAVFWYLNERSKDAENVGNTMAIEAVDGNANDDLAFVEAVKDTYESRVAVDGDAKDDSQEDAIEAPTDGATHCVSEQATDDDSDNDGLEDPLDDLMDDSSVASCFQDRSSIDHFVGVLDHLTQVLAEYRDYHLEL